MKILIITPYIPYPLNSGGNTAQFAILEKLQDRIDITLCLLIYEDEGVINIEKLSAKLPKIKFEIIDIRVSKPIRKGVIAFLRKVKFGLRMKLVKLFKAKEVIKSYDEFDYPDRINPLHIKPANFCTRLFEIIEKNPCDIIQVEFYNYIDLVDLLPRHIPAVFVHHEIRHERVITSAAISGKSEGYKKYICNIHGTIENAFLNKYNHIIVFSEIDKIKLEARVNKEITVIPFPILSTEFYYGRQLTKIDKLIFIGAENHYPNYEGVKWFIENCFELIWERNKIPLYIIGDWSMSTIDKYACSDKIIFTGFVENIKDICQNAISISPIRIGSGIRSKILYAMANKVLVVTTAKGVEGIPVVDSIHLRISDTEDGFVNCIQDLIDDFSLSKEMVRNAFEFVSLNYSQEIIVEQRMQFYHKLITN